MKQVFSVSNETSVKSTGIGSALAILTVFILAKFMEITAIDASIIVGSLTTIFNFVIKKEMFGK